MIGALVVFAGIAAAWALTLRGVAVPPELLTMKPAVRSIDVYVADLRGRWLWSALFVLFMTLGAGAAVVLVSCYVRATKLMAPGASRSWYWCLGMLAFVAVGFFLLQVCFDATTPREALFGFDPFFVLVTPGSTPGVLVRLTGALALPMVVMFTATMCALTRAALANTQASPARLRPIVLGVREALYSVARCW